MQINNTDQRSNDPYDNLFFNLDDYEDESEPLDDEMVKPFDDLVVEHPICEQSDKFIGCKVQLPLDGEMKEAIIERRKRDSDGMLIGNSNSNPYLDTRVYEAKFPDGTYNKHTANLIIENLHNQTDQFGRTPQLFKGIIDHRFTSEAIPKNKDANK